MSDTVCAHLNTITDVTPTGDGCQECLETGGWWVHLRLCMACGHVGCCDDSPNRHARAHAHATNHPVIRSYEPDETWFWCYPDELAFELANGPAPAHHS